jgi:hypothetical protein
MRPMRLIAEVYPGRYLAWSIKLLRGYWLTENPDHARPYESLEALRADYREAREWYDDLGWPRSARPVIDAPDGHIYRLTRVRPRAGRNA